MTWQESYEEWLACPDLNEEMKVELKELQDNKKALKEAFYAPLEFGTAGMRGILGAGINRMNIYTIKQATVGLALFIETLDETAKQAGVAIAYDSRHKSSEFGLEAAKVLANYGIQTYLFSSLRPTPELSFAVRELGCVAGIMITASHNPAEYNGYKVYGQDGGQMPPQDADALTAHVRSITNSLMIVSAEHTTENPSPFIKMIDEKVDTSYLDNLKKITLDQELVQTFGKELKLVYTPLHGTGTMIGSKALEQAGFKSYILEPAQMLADPNFTTVSSPNPEEYSAFEYAITLGKREGADLLVATDPDADRLGAAVRTPKGDYQILSGNQIAALLINYVLLKKSAKQELPETGVVLKSIVSSEFATAICEKYQVEMVNVLTGFKFIAEKIEEYETTKTKHFLFGFEESYGYLVQPFVRDKDAIQALVLLAEVAAYYKSKGMSLYDGVSELFEEYGYFSEKTISVTMSGIEGAQVIKDLMTSVRETPITEFANVPVQSIEDYAKQIKIDIEGHQTPIKLPKANVVKYALEDGSWIAIRPSGTEPKLKFYIGVKGESQENAQQKISHLELAVNKLLKDHVGDI